MYKSFSALEFKEMLGLPNDYHIEGLLTYGAWDRPKHDAHIQRAMKDLGIECAIKKLDDFLQHISEITIGGKRYWFTMMYGSALLSEMVHLACLFGSKRNIHIGSCGGLNPEINDMQLIVPTWSFGNESTTRTYEPEARDFKHQSDPRLSKEIINNLPKEYKVWEGPIITNQAMMGETWDDVKSWSEQGYFGVEMETSTLFAVSRHFKVPAAALVYVSDNLIKGQTVGDETHIQQKEVREKVKMDVYKAGVKTMIA